MRLLFEDDHGQAIEIGAAIRQSPYRLRGLLAEALWQCHEIFPDTMAYLHTERALRESLQLFQGDQERYARNYVVKRVLETHAQGTPRSNLLAASLQSSGVLAFLGVFYATRDTLRNVRNRDTLTYLLGCSDEARRELLDRSGSFPCHATTGEWLERIFRGLEPDSCGMASILWHLGSSAVPIAIFRRAQAPSAAWDRDGEAAEVPPPNVPFIQDQQRLATAIYNLELVGLGYSTADTVGLRPGCSTLLATCFREAGWARKAVQLACHAFPCRVTEPRAPNADGVVPCVQYALTHHADLQGANPLDDAQLMQLADTALAASFFGAPEWKAQALSLAAQASRAMAAGDDPLVAFMQARVQIRRAELAHLYGLHSQSEDAGQADVPTQPNALLSQVLSAESAILQARQHTGLNRVQFASLLPYWALGATRMEQMQQKRANVAYARLLRFQGLFSEAYQIASLSSDAKSTLVAASSLSELGRCDEALRLLRTARPTVAVRLAVANTHLMQSMHSALAGRQPDPGELQATGDLFRMLNADHDTVSYYGKVRHLAVLVGLAVTAHLGGEENTALKQWKAVLGTLQGYFPADYLEALVHYAIAELEFRRKDVAPAEASESYARVLLARTGRQYHFTGLGSLWPDILGMWLKGLGRERLL